MIALMQEDTRKEKERGVENLTIGYFVMKVTIKWRWCELWKYNFKWRYDRRSGNCKLSNCKLNRIKKISRLQRARARIPLNHGLESRRLNCNYHCDDHISTEKLNGEVKIQKLKTKMENWVKNKNEITVCPPLPQFTSSSLCFIPFKRWDELNKLTNVWIFIAQFVEHCSANAEAMGSNPVEVPISFSLIAIS